MTALQYITHQTPSVSYLEGAIMALQGGCRWVQMRLKGEPRPDDPSPLDCGKALLRLCRAFGATFIVDDDVELALQLHADGVHLGRHDMPIAEARRRLGSSFIIGGTANTIDDIRLIAAQGADYIGCGPFRFTSTKKNLAPQLGLEGYRQLVGQMRAEGISLPLVAIGGITADDIADLAATGVSGIAVSGAILSAYDPEEATRQLISLIGSDSTPDPSTH